MAIPYNQLAWSDPQTYNYLEGQGANVDRAILQCIHDDVIVDATDTNTIAEWTGDQEHNPHPDGVLIAIEQNSDTSPDGRTILHNCGVQYAA